MRFGRRLGVDVGDVRIGVAGCDPSGILATPLETVPAGDGAIARIAELAGESEAIEVVVGLPRSLSGGEGPAAVKVRAWAAAAAAQLPPIRLVDERMTTMTATDQLQQSGRRGTKARRVVDQVAATVILQSALDAERAGNLLGEMVEVNR